MGRTMLEQEFYEQFIDQGMDEYSADLIAHEQAVEYEGGNDANNS
jgi:hypothetical protein